MSDFFAPSYWYGAGPNIAPLPINTNYGAQLNQQLAYVGGQNQAALAAAAPTPPGYGQVHLPYLSGSFGPAAAAGTYSPGSGLSSFSGISLGRGGYTPPAMPTYSGGGIGSDAARAPNQPAIQSTIPWGGYNAPMQYGWMHNEGAPAPAAPQVFNRGEFKPQTYGWDHNEGAPVPQGGFGMFGANSGSLGTMSPFGGYQPSTAPLSQPFGSIWNRVAPQVPTFPSSVTVPQQQGFLGGSAWARGTPAGTRAPVPDARTYMPSGQFGGYLDHNLWGAKSGNLGTSSSLFGGNRDTAALGGWPFGGYVSDVQRSTLTPSDRAIGLQASDRFGAFNPYSFSPSAMGAPASAFARMAGAGGSGGIGSDMLRGNQNGLYAQPWHSLIPSGTPNTPEIIKQINYTAGRGRYDPAALAGVINTESRWNPRTNTGSYFGATQMGADTFKDFGRLGGMDFSQYKAAPLERQIPAYGDWLANYARAPNSAARLATSDIRSHPVPMQAAILQGTQFSPYGGLAGTPQWPQAFARGDTTSISPSPIQRSTGLPAPQADFLSLARGLPPTLSSMNAYYGRTIPR